MIFDRHFAAEGWFAQAAIHRLRPDLITYVLVVDTVVAKGADKWKANGIVGVPLADLEAAYPVLCQARAARPWSAYILTLRPFFLHYILDQYAPRAVVYMDSDVYFWSDPMHVFWELNGAPITVVKSGPNKWIGQGRYNGGFVACLNKPDTYFALAWLQDAFVASCAWGHNDAGTSVDEGHLEDLAEIADGAFVSSFAHPGINMLPCHTHREVQFDADTGLSVDGKELVCFHYIGFDRDLENGCTSCIQDDLATYVYAPYALGLNRFSVEQREWLHTY